MCQQRRVALSSVCVHAFLVQPSAAQNMAAAASATRTFCLRQQQFDQQQDHLTPYQEYGHNLPHPRATKRAAVLANAVGNGEYFPQKISCFWSRLVVAQVNGLFRANGGRVRFRATAIVDNRRCTAQSANTKGFPTPQTLVCSRRLCLL